MQFTFDQLKADMAQTWSTPQPTILPWTINPQILPDILCCFGAASMAFGKSNSEFICATKGIWPGQLRSEPQYRLLELVDCHAIVGRVCDQPVEISPPRPRGMALHDGVRPSI